MNKPEIIAATAEKAGVTKNEAKSVIDALFETLGDAVKERQEVSIPGAFSIRYADRAAREGRNPQTGETVQIAARTAVTIKPSDAWKKAAAAS